MIYKFNITYEYCNQKHQVVMFAETNIKAIEALELYFERKGIYLDKRPAARKARKAKGT